MDSGLNERATPVLVLDQALSLLRRASAEQWLRGLVAGLPLATLLLGLYALEHVVGVQPPRPLLGCLCALAYWARFRALSLLARELVGLQTLRSVLGERTPWLSAFKTAMVAGIGSWCWAMALLAAARSSFVMLLVCLPVLCLRGAVAPSLLARSACARESGLPALARASADTHGARQLFAGVELLAVLGMLVLFANLYALAALSLLVASALLGLDVGFVSALIAPDNELVPLLLLGLAALALEPLRAAISAVAFQRARERFEGADLHAAIAGLSPVPNKHKVAQPAAAERVLIALLFTLCTPMLLRAEPSIPEAGDLAKLDDQARDKARAILAGGEFLPSETDSGQSSFRSWLERRVREPVDRDVSAPPRFQLSLPPSAVMLGAALIMLAVGAWFTRSLRSARRNAAAAFSSSVTEPSTAECVAEAARLAEQAEYGEGVRRLYAACLRAVGRFDAAHTNGQVMQRLAPGALKEAFESLTVRVERCSYGRQAATRADYEGARELTDRVLRAAEELP